MSLKVCCLAVIFFVGCSAFADAIVQRRYPSKTTAIQSSSIVYSNSDSRYDSDSLQPAIKEIQKKINITPNDYILYASLVDLYMKTKDYDKAYDELVFLANLARQNKLNATTKNYISGVYENIKKNSKYSRTKAPIYVNLAMMALILDDKENAEAYINAAADYPLNLNVLKSALTIIFDLTGNSEKAIGVCDKIIAKNLNDIEIRKIKAAYYIQNKNKDAAIVEYSKILDIQPSDEDSKYYLYKLLSSKNASEKDILKHLYKTDKPNYETVYYELANMLLKNGELNSSKLYANALVEKYPNNANGYIILSEIYQKEGKLKESYEILSKARDKADSNESIAKYNVLLAKLSDEPVKEANSLIATGLYQQALDVLDGANQENLYVILTQARANYLLNEKQQTLALLNKAMTLYPENSDVYCAFGYIYLKEKDIESARKYVNNSLRINPKNKTAIDLQDMVNKAEASKFTNQIISAFEAQNYTESMRLIDEALKINAKDPVLYYYKALTYIAQNNYAASTALLYKCIELDKNNIPAYFYLGIAFDNLSEPENALVYYQKFINLLPKDDYGESEKLNYAKTRIEKLKG